MENQILDDVFKPEETAVTLVEADRGLRFANLLLDYIGIIAFIFVIMLTAFLVGAIDEADLENEAFANLFCYASMFSYYVLCEYFLKGKTLGKFVTHTRVVTLDGEQPTLLTIIGRTLCRFIPIEPFSFLGSRLSGWHDRLSKTMVIKERQSNLPISDSELV